MLRVLGRFLEPVCLIELSRSLELFLFYVTYIGSTRLSLRLIIAYRFTQELVHVLLVYYFYGIFYVIHFSKCLIILGVKIVDGIEPIDLTARRTIFGSWPIFILI